MQLHSLFWIPTLGATTCHWHVLPPPSCIAVRDFKECLEDFEVQVAEFSDELQALEALTAETVSFEVIRLERVPRSPEPRPPVLCCLCRCRCAARHAGSACAAVQELIGHCSALYAANRDATHALEAHLEQYGYVPPSSDTHEPDDPCLAGEQQRPWPAGDCSEPPSPRDDATWGPDSGPISPTQLVRPARAAKRAGGGSRHGGGDGLWSCG